MPFMTRSDITPFWMPALTASLLVACTMLAGCASSRVLKAPVPTKGSDLGWEAATPDGLSVAIDQVIVPNGGGSWVRDANWDEYAVTIVSESQVPVEIEGIELYSAKLALPVQSSNSQEQLAMQRKRLQQDLRDVGLVGGTGILSAGVAAAAGSAAGPAGFMTASGMVAAAAIAVFPIAVVGGTSYVVSRRHRANEDKVKIDHIFQERGVGIPVQINPGAPLRKSVFFPLTPDPTRLVVHYTVGGTFRELAVNLPAMAAPQLQAKAQRPR